MTMEIEAACFSEMLVSTYKKNILPPTSWLPSTIPHDATTQKKI
jgi:hypothetical protein